MGEDMEEILKTIAEVWKETKEHFGDAFPFKDALPFKIIDDGVFMGKIIFKEVDDD